MTDIFGILKSTRIAIIFFFLMEDCSYLEKTFSFVNERFAGSSCPGMNSPLKTDLNFLKEQGIQSIISLNESGIDKQTVLDAKFRHLTLAVEDYRPPSIEDLKKLEKFILEGEKDEKILVHCNAGMGRTGTVLACLIVWSGSMTAEEAIKYLRKKRKGSVQTFKQVIYHVKIGSNQQI